MLRPHWCRPRWPDWPRRTQVAGAATVPAATRAARLLPAVRTRFEPARHHHPIINSGDGRSSADPAGSTRGTSDGNGAHHQPREHPDVPIDPSGGGRRDRDLLRCRQQSEGLEAKLAATAANPARAWGFLGPRAHHKPPWFKSLVALTIRAAPLRRICRRAATLSHGTPRNLNQRHAVATDESSAPLVVLAAPECQRTSQVSGQFSGSKARHGSK